MARVYLTTGLCPTCGRDVARTVNLHHGLHAEVYHCPEHGRLANHVEKVSLYEWVQSRSAEPLDSETALEWVR